MNTSPLFPLLLALCAGATCANAGGIASHSPRDTPVQPPVFTRPTEITHPYHPFVVGRVKLFTGREEGSRIALADLYTDRTRTFPLNGSDVTTRVLQETEFLNGRLSEISQNYFAQADDGTVYYFGEVVAVYEKGQIVSHEGSWLVGGPTEPDDPGDSGNAPAPGVFMPPNPRVGDTFKPEDLLPLVDETVKVLEVNRRVAVPAGHFRKVIKDRETSRIAPGREFKWYAPGNGVVLARQKGEFYKLIAISR